MKRLSLLALLACSGCFSAHGKANEAPSPAPLPPTVVATIGTLRPEMTLSGIVAPYQNVEITSALSEPADEVRVRNGDRVAAGDVLAILDSADIRANLDAAIKSADSADAKTAQTRYQATLSIAQGRNSVTQEQAALDQARQTLAQDQRDLERDRELLAQQFVSQQEYDQQRTRVDNDRQNVANALAALNSAIVNRDVNGTTTQGLQAANVTSAAAQAAASRATAAQYRAQLDKTTIVSPVDGVVTQRTLNPGEYPEGRTLFVVQQLDPVYVDLNASSAQVFETAVGSEARVAVAGTRYRADARVTAVLGQTQPGSTNFTVELRARNPLFRLKSGMPVTGTVLGPVVRGVVVPLSAFTSELHDRVVVLTGSSAHAAPVRTIAIAGDRAVVTGLRPGMRVVRDGGDGLALVAESP